MTTSLSENWILGVDPGGSGGIAIINGDSSELYYHASPLRGKRINVSILSELIQDLFDNVGLGKLDIFIEDVAAIFGSGCKQTFNFGRNVGMVWSVVEMVTEKPFSSIMFVGAKNDWQKALYYPEDKVFIEPVLLGVTELKKVPGRKLRKSFPVMEEDPDNPGQVKQVMKWTKRKHDTKATALKKARALFPKEHLAISPGEKFHDGIVDAVLIAEYGRRKLYGE